ncbi:tetratricopeptide repeat protein [Streptomyces sp. AC602_WCS936]|uniref:tetratricopeptide repeat protein n=1 Tax=Streptomyces sp. AC602_WCS936 TaxID=2823685 RepID=UPI001C265633|nr:tetratricopeptide repeat protein [Streptomyces sp. AC602_WCS936]
MPIFSRSEHKRQKNQAGQERPPAPGLKPIDVHVTADGSASVGGLPVVAGSGESVQDAVLDYLHQLVLATGHAVAADVHDERIGYSTPIRVAADGSSRFAGEPVPLPRQARPDVAAAVGTAPPYERPAGREQDGPMPPERVPAAPARPARDKATRALRAVPDRVSGEPAPRMPAPEPERSGRSDQRSADRPAAAVAAPVDAAAPALLAEPVRRINEAVSMGRIESAATMAEQAISSAARTLGAEHPETLQLRELAAYIAYLAKDAQRSFVLSMALARVRRGRDDEAALGNVQSAAAAWRALPDPVQGLALGHELIALWSEMLADGSRSGADPAHLEAARARMGRLAARADALRDSRPDTEGPYAQPR